MISNDEIYQFDTKEPVLDYVAHLGNNDVMDTFVITKNYIYISSCSDKVVNKNMIPFPVTLDNIKRLVEWDCN
jgi:hypothetical protein